MVSVDLQRRLHQQHCAEKGNIWLHFDTLHLMHEDLASMGHAPSEDDFYAILIGSLPLSYDPYVSALNATSSVLRTFLSPDDLMHTITNEYKRRNLGKTSKQEENAAFHAEDEGRNGRSMLTCFNCGKKGHKKVDCWGEGGGKAGQAPCEKGKGGSDEKGGGKEKEDKAKEKEAAASANEYLAAWMVMSDESDIKDGNKDTFSPVPSTFPSLDELLDGFNPNNNKIPIARSPLDSDDEGDEGDLDEWEDDSEGVELGYVDEVAGERMPLEGKIEDLDVPEELWASANPIPTENDVRQTPTPIPESIFEEDKGVLLPVPPVAEDVQCTREDENAITMPQEVQMVAEKAEEDEDQTMALWLSDPDEDESMDKEDWAVSDEAGTQIENAPVEGKGRDFDKRVDDKGNQPIPQPAKLPPAQPEEQGECRGKAASGGSGEGVDEANEAENDEKGRHRVCPEEEGRRKVCPSAADDAKSVLHPRIPMQHNLDDAKFVSRPMDLENTLSDGQHLPSRAKIKKTESLPFREGIGPSMHTPKPNAIATDAINHEIREEPPQISLDKSRGGGGTSCINARKDGEGATHLDRAKHDLRDLEGEGNFSLVNGEEKDLLPDPGGAPLQQEKSLGKPKGAQDNGEGGTGPWVNPREQEIAAWTTRKKKTDDVAVIRAITHAV